MFWVVVLIIIFVIPEETLECMLGAILGSAAGLIVIVLIFAVLYGIYTYGSNIVDEIKNHFK